MSKTTLYETADGGTGWYVHNGSQQVFRGVNCGRSERDAWGTDLIRLRNGTWLECAWDVWGPRKPEDRRFAAWEVGLDRVAEWFPENYQDPPEVLIEDLARAKSEGATPPSKSSSKTSEPKQTGNKPAGGSDRPSPDDFRAYYASQHGVRQDAIAEVLGISQPTVSRMINKVKRWHAKGNKLPGLDELSKLEPRPLTYQVDPHEMGRWEDESGAEDDE